MYSVASVSKDNGQHLSSFTNNWFSIKANPSIRAKKVLAVSVRYRGVLLYVTNTLDCMSGMWQTLWIVCQVCDKHFGVYVRYVTNSLLCNKLYVTYLTYNLPEYIINQISNVYEVNIQFFHRGGHSGMSTEAHSILQYLQVSSHGRFYKHILNICYNHSRMLKNGLQTQLTLYASLITNAITRALMQRFRLDVTWSILHDFRRVN